MKKKLVSILLVLCIGAVMSGCGSSSAGQGGTTASETADKNATLKLAYQYGLAYAPAVLAEKQGLIEKAYKEKTGGELTIEWNQMSSGADINTALTAGELHAGFMGIPPAINAVTKGLGVKVFSNLSGQEHGLAVNDDSVKSLGDLVGTDKQIALVNLGSFQHITLAKALVNSGFDAHALDSNIVAMKHPDGMAALENGSVTGHVTSSPYLFKERDNSSFHEIPELNEAHPRDYSFIVGLASEDFHDKTPEVYDALCEGISEAIDLINNDPAQAASILYDTDGNTKEEEEEYIKLGVYTTETNNLFETAKFMYDNGFIDNEPSSYEDLVFDNVKGN